MKEQLAEMHVIFKGKVQGVGFRSYVSDSALKYKLPGFVKNLPDGSVELVIQGSDKRKLKTFLNEVQTNASFARIEIESLSSIFRSPSRIYHEFTIQF